MSYKILPHLDHVDMLEVATYRKNQDKNEPLDSVTVECTKCGEVVEEIYNASEDNIPPLDCEFPSADPEPWSNNEAQFARLLFEITGVLNDEQFKNMLNDLCRSMDLGPDDLIDVFQRAERVWEQAKAEVN